MEERTFNMHVASSGRRFINFIGDIMICLSVVFLPIFLLFKTTLFFQYLQTSDALAILFLNVMLFFYYFVFETAFQRTPAKFLTGTKVVMQDGSKPYAGTIAKRSLSRFVPFEPLSRSEGTWWHDRWTKTRVVIVKTEEEPKPVRWILLTLAILFGLNVIFGVYQIGRSLIETMSAVSKVQSPGVFGAGAGGALAIDGVKTIIMFLLTKVCWQEFRKRQKGGE